MKEKKYSCNYIMIFLILLMFFMILISVDIYAENLSSNNSLIYFNYQKMKKALIKYENILLEGGWESIAETDTLNEEDYGQNIYLLKKRLIKTNDLKEEYMNDPFHYDLKLKKAISQFQNRHGLETTGVVDKETLQVLNVPVEKRIQQINSNINSMSNYINKLEGKYIIVNIPDFNLYVINKGRRVMSMKVIVGSIENQTPIFNSKITHLELNPSWIIPYNTSLATILPKIKNNPAYIETNHIKVFKDWGDNSIEIDPNTIDWSKVTNNNLIYRFTQEPGPENPMGSAKFKLPNKYNISLHDTPNKSLFNEKTRTFSRGCIRLENALGLAQYLLNDISYILPEKVSDLVKSGESKEIYLKEPFPVFLVYWTVWVNEDGVLNFRSDIYNKY